MLQQIFTLIFLGCQLTVVAMALMTKDDIRKAIYLMTVMVMGPLVFIVGNMPMGGAA